MALWKSKCKYFAMFLRLVIVSVLACSSVWGAAVVPCNITQNALWCYECKENYHKRYDPYASPCKNNISEISIRPCGATDRYCKIETMVLHRSVITIERGCTKDCPYGCRYNGYGLTYVKCTTCCRSSACNSGNGASSVTSSYRMQNWFAKYLLTMATIYWTRLVI